MKHFGHGVRMLGATVLLAGGVGAAGASAATATQTSTSCVGTLVESHLLKGESSGTTLGSLNIYWDSATGQNCAMTTSSSSTWGVAKSMTVEIWECVTDRPSSASPCVAIAGTGTSDFKTTYRYYAGPVSAPGAGHCIDAYGQIIMSSGDYAAYDTGAGHC
jgi:hypothetical protein